MVKVIAKELRAQSSGNCDIDPNLVLSIIESFGMLPPPNYIGIDDCGCMMPEPNYTWEPEE